jgi:hypothetical protein
MAINMAHKKIHVTSVAEAGKTARGLTVFL